MGRPPEQGRRHYCSLEKGKQGRRDAQKGLLAQTGGPWSCRLSPIQSDSMSWGLRDLRFSCSTVPSRPVHATPSFLSPQSLHPPASPAGRCRDRLDTGCFNSPTAEEAEAVDAAL